MKKNVVIVEMKTNQEADQAVLEIDDAVRESEAALDSGKVRPSASGLVRDASGLIRDAVMYIVLEKEGSMSSSELGKFLGCKRNLVVEYARAHQDLFEISNNGISSKKISLKSNGKENKDPEKFILELLSFCENFCDIPSDEILTRNFLKWLKNDMDWQSLNRQV